MSSRILWQGSVNQRLGCLEVGLLPNRRGFESQSEQDLGLCWVEVICRCKATKSICMRKLYLHLCWILYWIPSSSKLRCVCRSNHQCIKCSQLAIKLKSTTLLNHVFDPWLWSLLCELATGIAIPMLQPELQCSPLDLDLHSWCVSWSPHSSARWTCNLETRVWFPVAVPVVEKTFLVM